MTHIHIFKGSAKQKEKIVFVVIVYQNMSELIN